MGTCPGGRPTASRAIPGLLLFLAFASAASAAAPLTLVGTTVGADGTEPSVGVHVTLWPKGISTWSDQDGDFLLPWDGSRGWLTLVPSDSMLTGTLWCKRLALRPVEGASATPNQDLGYIRVTGRARLTYMKIPALPKNVHRPDTLAVAGPAPGARDTCHVRLQYEVDIWGRTTKVEHLEGDRQPEALVNAILDWTRHVEWIVPNETRCESDPPFSAVDEVYYLWSGGHWTRVDLAQLRFEQMQRAREARQQSGSPTK